MINFQYARASDVSDAVKQIAADPEAKFIAGGTNLLGLMKEDVERPTRLIDISRLPLKTVEETKDGFAVRYALAALKGVGQQAVELIIDTRSGGQFTSLADFASRANPRAINKRIIESLAAAGAFDTLEPNRARVFAGADAILAACQRSHEAATSGRKTTRIRPTSRS